MKKIFIILLAAATMVGCCKKAATTAEESVEQAIPSIEDVYGEWNITEIDGLAIGFEAPITLNDSSFATIICNNIFGKLYQQDRRADGIRLDAEGRTMKACMGEEAEAENAFLRVLPLVRNFVCDDSTLVLLDENEVTLLKMSK